MRTFYIILEIIGPHLEKKVTNFKKPISPEERLVITLRLVKYVHFKNTMLGIHRSISKYSKAYKYEKYWLNHKLPRAVFFVF